LQPPKRRGTATSSAPKGKKTSQSKLAKENDISAKEEAEIKETFHLFSVENEDYASEKEGVIKTQDVRRALVYIYLFIYLLSWILPRMAPVLL
jgi:hypothetical protein